MTWRAWRENWRWWDWVLPGLVFVMMVTNLLVVLLMRSVAISASTRPADDAFDRVMRLGKVMVFVTLVAGAAGLLWLALVQPWFESGDKRCTEQRTPERRKKMIRAFAWTPFVIAVAAPVLLLTDAVMNWLLTRLWEPAAVLSFWWALPIFTFALFGWRYDRFLQRRLHASVKRAGVCFHCAYSLAQIPDCQRCPECGHAVG